MSKDIKDMSLPINRFIELGQVDAWLRGIADIVPHPAETGDKVMQERELHASVPGLTVNVLDSNLHVLPLADRHLIDSEDITRMKGFHNLIHAASRNNVRVDIENIGGSALEVAFEPDEPFSRSLVFGATYANVLPTLFGTQAVNRRR
ncbi:MAG TPA: hypothetical protein VEF76_07875 [Patescibacteria group bacterium]|nr:hypothetical protein [Patescibacteria group bacterium]